MGTPCDINLQHTQDQVQITFICRGCRTIESQQVASVMTPFFMQPGMMVAPPGYWLQPPDQVKIEPPKPEPEAEPEKEEPTPIAKLMQKLISAENMKDVERHRLDLKEWEYNYVIDTIKRNKEERKNKKIV
jgi:hypothetical protein